MNKELSQKPGGAVPFISLKGIRKVFPDGNEALRGIDLTIEQGECVLIAGANGSGKTVLMQILSGLMKASGGEVRIRGKLLKRDKRNFTSLMKEGILAGLVFQNPDAQFLGETVREDIAIGPINLGLDKAEQDRRVEAALDASGLREKAGAAPRSLSGGEKRRLAVAGILAMDAGIVILDEPFANLDFPGVVQTLRVIRDLKEKGRTVLILTHELEKVLALAGRLVILNRGALVCQGKPEAVLDRLESSWGIRDPRQSCSGVKDCTWN
ncbi:MAG: energy-coupling factor ABC transporter ATP-binding protein [Spirochaetaceae bacterium]|jgi:biotin transport system ATP-binding protein|nr:energy-coupling factor ABC transporter ATP-binding protein [Spirochaetaceae bacterium]